MSATYLESDIYLLGVNGSSSSDADFWHYFWHVQVALFADDATRPHEY